MANFNPGEPVFDQGAGGRYGEPVIDPRTGDFIEVTPNAQVQVPRLDDPSELVTHDADDVTNGAFFRANTRIGEVIRDQSQGVQESEILLAFQPTLDAAVGQITDALRSTPGVEGVTNVRITEYDKASRSIQLSYRLRKSSGTGTVAAIRVGG